MARKAPGLRRRLQTPEDGPGGGLAPRVASLGTLTRWQYGQVGVIGPWQRSQPKDGPGQWEGDPGGVKSTVDQEHGDGQRVDVLAVQIVTPVVFYHFGRKVNVSEERKAKGAPDTPSDDE